MIIPIGDDQVRNGAFPLITYLFLGLNILVFFYEVTLTPEELNHFVLTYGTSAQKLMGGEFYSVFTSMFIHGSWMHLIGNMMFLWVFADNIEAVIGSLRFIVFYLIGGIGAVILQTFMDFNSIIPMIGASGAIAAVLGAYLVMFPGSRIKLVILIFFITIRIPAIFFLGFWILQQFVAGFSSYGVATNLSDASSVAWWAHIGGVIVGVFMGFYLRRKFLKDYHSIENYSNSNRRS